MDKNEFAELVLLSLYGELDEQEERELTELLSGSREHVEEYRALVRVHMLAGGAALEVPEPMILQAREQLGRALAAAREDPLRAMPHSAGLKRKRILMGASVFAGWAKYATGLAAGLLMGFLFLGSSGMPAFDGVPDLASLDEDTSISNVRFVPAGGDEKTVELSFSATRDYRFTDSIDNPAVQRMLAYSLVRESNPGIRIRTVGALSKKAGSTDQEVIKNALLTAVVTDENPVVRGQALEALRKYPADRQIQGTLINVLRFDKNSKLRMEAVQMLTGLVAGGETLPPENIDALRNQVEVEDNLYLKSQLNNILEQVSLEQL